MQFCAKFIMSYIIYETWSYLIHQGEVDVQPKACRLTVFDIFNIFRVTVQAVRDRTQQVRQQVCQQVLQQVLLHLHQQVHQQINQQIHQQVHQQVHQQTRQQTRQKIRQEVQQQT